MKFLNAAYILFVSFINNSLFSIDVQSSITSRLIENTVGPTLFADDQGSEIPDSAEFYNLVKTLTNNKNNAANNTKRNDSVITISSVISNNTMWSEDIATTIFTPSIVKNNTTWSEDAAMTLFIPSAISNNTTQWKKEDATNAANNASDKPLPY